MEVEIGALVDAEIPPDGEVTLTVVAVNTSARPPQVVLEGNGTKVVVYTDDQVFLCRLAGLYRQAIPVRFGEDEGEGDPEP